MQVWERILVDLQNGVKDHPGGSYNANVIILITRIKADYQTLRAFAPSISSML